MSSIFISVIIPVYNVQDYIVDCLDSIASQTYTSDVECIIVDDCGTDKSMQLVQNFFCAYRGEILFRIIKHTHNSGLSAARNTGIVNANGKYVVFFDSDDTITADCLLRFMETALQYPKAEMIAAGLQAKCRNSMKRYSMEKALPEYADNSDWISKTILMRGGWVGIPVNAVNRLVKREFILRYNLFFREGVLHEDELWNFMLAQKLNYIAFCKHNTYIRRIRPYSITTSFKTKDDDARSCLPVWHEMLDRFTPELAKEQTYSLWHFINDISPSCYDPCVRKETLGILWQLVKKRIWPTSFLILIYIMPPIFYVKFLRKLIVKASCINLARISPTIH